MAIDTQVRPTAASTTPGYSRAPAAGPSGWLRGGVAPSFLERFLVCFSRRRSRNLPWRFSFRSWSSAWHSRPSVSLGLWIPSVSSTSQPAGGAVAAAGRSASGARTDTRPGGGLAWCRLLVQSAGGCYIRPSRAGCVGRALERSDARSRWAFGALLGVVANFRAFGQRLEAAALDRGVVDERVPVGVIRGNEPKPLSSLNHFRFLLTLFPPGYVHCGTRRVLKRDDCENTGHCSVEANARPVRRVQPVGSRLP
jgi:hypothetical protein